MWAQIALEMKIPWRAAEGMHWQLGEVEIAQRAGTVPFSSVALEASLKKRDLEPSPKTLNLGLGTNAAESRN